MTVYTCRYPGCDAEVNSDRGVASRCREHRGVPAPDTRPKPPVTNEARAKELLASAKALDRAKADAKKAIEKTQAARERHNAALRALTEALSGGDE